MPKKSIGKSFEELVDIGIHMSGKNREKYEAMLSKIGESLTEERKERLARLGRSVLKNCPEAVNAPLIELDLTKKERNMDQSKLILRQIKCWEDDGYFDYKIELISPVNRKFTLEKFQTKSDFFLTGGHNWLFGVIARNHISVFKSESRKCAEEFSLRWARRRLKALAKKHNLPAIDETVRQILSPAVKLPKKRREEIQQAVEKVVKQREVHIIGGGKLTEKDKKEIKKIVDEVCDERKNKPAVVLITGPKSKKKPAKAMPRPK